MDNPVETVESPLQFGFFFLRSPGTSGQVWLHTKVNNPLSSTRFFGPLNQKRNQKEKSRLTTPVKRDFQLNVSSACANKR